MSGLSAAPSDSVQPQKTGEPCTEPSRKTQTAATSLPAITAFSMTPFLIWHLLIWCRFLLVLPQGGRGGGGNRVGCSLRRKVRKKTSTLHSIVPLSVILSLPRLRKIARQTDSAGVLSPFSSSVVEFICSGFVPDTGCHVSYWLFSSRSENTHPEPWWNNEGGMQPQRSGRYNSGHAILHL